MIAQATDPLEQDLETITTWCATHQLQLVHGYFAHSDAIPVVHCNEDSDRELASYLETARALGAKAVIANVTRLTEDDWRSTIDQLDRGRPPAQSRELAELKSCQNRVGHISALEVCVVTGPPTLLLRRDRYAKWFDLVYASDEHDADLRGGIPVSAEMQRRVESIARKVASDAAFQRAKNENQRHYIASRIFDSDGNCQGVEFWRVAREAEMILDSEVRPRLEEELSRRVRTLRSDGCTQQQIASELGVSLHKVRLVLGSLKE